MNVALSSRHTVHTSHKSGGPRCHAFGAPHGSESYRPTDREVSCKKCLKMIAEDAEYAKRTARYAEAANAPLAESERIFTEAEPVEVVEAEKIAELTEPVAVKMAEVTEAAGMWGRTKTGKTFHEFLYDGSAVCRRSIKQGHMMGGYSRERAMKDVASIYGRVNGRSMCQTCVEMDDAHRVRVEASMAPVDPYDQACEGIVTPEAEANYRAYIERDMDAMHAEALALDAAETELAKLTPEVQALVADVVRARLSALPTDELVALFPTPQPSRAATRVRRVVNLKW